MQARMSRRSTVLLAALFSLTLLTGSAHPPRHNEASRRAAVRSVLAAALGPARHLEGRLAGLPYAPFNPAPPRVSKALRTVLRNVESNAVKSSPEDLALLALAKLVGGKTRRAVEEFERAATVAPTSAVLLSDLSAAYLADARENREPASLVKALESAERAVELDPHLPSALFNRALARESLHLGGQARIAWKQLMEIESGSGWSAEARRRIARLPVFGAAVQRWEAAKRELDEAAAQGDSLAVDRIVAKFPQASREYAEEILLGEWAEAWKARNAEKVHSALTSARMIGAALRQRNGDRMIFDAVAVIERTIAEPASRLEFLAAGHQLYREGLRLYQEGLLVEARNRFQSAERNLAQARSPFAGWASFRLAVCEMQNFDYGQALARLDRIREADPLYTSLMGRSYWITGLIHVIQARPTEALAAYRVALRVFERLGETENHAIISALIAESLWSSGDLQSALPYHLSALRSVQDLREGSRRQVVLEGSGLTALSLGKPLAALAFQQEALANLEGSGSAASWIYGLRRRALIEIRAGRIQQARQDLTEARARLTEIADQGFRDSLLGDILAVEGQLYGTEAPQKAVPKLSEAIGIYRNTRYQTQLALFLGYRARAQASLGRLDAAEADYGEAVRVITQQNEATSQEDLRAWYLNASRSIFQELIQLQVRHGEAEKALSYAEIGRAQLLRANEPNEPVAMSASEISERIPPSVALIEFWFADRQLYTWVVRRGSITLIPTRLDSSALGRRIERFRREIKDKSSKGKQDSRALFDILISPLETLLRGARTVVLVLDEELYNLPFAALLDPAGRYLIERYALAVSPSASLYIRARSRGEQRAAFPLRSVLSLGDPDLDRQVLQNLPRLAKAREEAVQITRLYPESAVRLGADATRQAFLAGLATYDIVHFAGHAVVNPIEPASSFLALAPSMSGRDSGILYVHDLYGVPSPVSRLVVLSACSTAWGDARLGEGVAGIARPFLSAGVPAVVGSFWQVDDYVGAALFVRFYRRLRAGLQISEALRQAQIEMLSSSDSQLSDESSWAGFQVFGVGG
jgi:CHAT domain-containing protein